MGPGSTLGAGEGSCSQLGPGPLSCFSLPVPAVTVCAGQSQQDAEVSVDTAVVCTR